MSVSALMMTANLTHASVSCPALVLLPDVVEENAAAVQEHVSCGMLRVPQAGPRKLGTPRRVAARHENGRRRPGQKIATPPEVGLDVDGLHLDVTRL